MLSPPLLRVNIVCGLQHSNLLALGMKESAGAGFDDIGTELEIHMADFTKKDLKTKLQGSVRTQSRFTLFPLFSMYIEYMYD